MSLTTIRLSEAWNWGGLSARELAVRTWRAIDKHETIDRAATIAFYAMLAFVPLLSLALALSGAVAFYAMLSFVPMLGFALALGSQAGLTTHIESLSADLLPPAAQTIVTDQISKINQDRPVGLLSLSALLLLWSASSLFVAIMDATNAAYEVRDTRPWWKARLMAIVLTVVEAALLLGASASITAWPAVAGWLRLGGVALALATVVPWLGVGVALLAAFAVAYYFGPHIDQKWEWITPGSALGVLVLVVASLGFRGYVYFGPSYSETYGALTGVVLMLLWLYLASLALLVGAEINSVIEHAAPHGRRPGQKEDPGAQVKTEAEKVTV